MEANRIIFFSQKQKQSTGIYQGPHLIATDKNSCLGTHLQLLRVRRLSSEEQQYYSNIPNVQAYQKHPY